MVTSKKIVKVRLSFVLYRNLETSLEDSTTIKGFLSVWGFNGELRRLMAATGGCGWWRRSLGRWKWFWGRGRERKDCFSKATRKIRLATLKCFCSRERKRLEHTRIHIANRNSQIVESCPMNLQTKFGDDPTVNKCRRVFLPRELHTASLRSFSREASLRSFLERLI